MTDLPPVGSIGLVRVSGLTGLLIRLGQWWNGDGFGNYEHAFMLTDTDSNGSGFRWVVEAEPGGVREVALFKYRGREVLWLECPPEHSFDVVAAAKSYIGVDYSFADYFAIAAQRLDLPVAMELRREVSRKKHQICSSMVDAAASRGGWELFRGGMWPGYVTPARLAALAPSGAVPQRIE